MAIAEKRDQRPTGRRRAWPAEPGRRERRRRERSARQDGQAREATTGSMSATVFTAEESAPHVEAWRRLAETALEPNPFFGPDFLLPYLRHMDTGDAAIVAVRSEPDGGLVALAPFGRRRPGLLMPRLTALAGDYGPLGAPLLAPDADSSALRSLLEAASARFGGGPMVFPYLRTDGPVFDLFLDLEDEAGWHVAGDNPSLRAGHATGPTGREQYGLLGSRRRKELDRQFRRLSDGGAVELASAEAPGQVAAAFERFLELEAAGWKGRRRTALASTADRIAFARGFIHAAAHRGNVRIDTLTRDGRALAVLVMLRDRDRIFSWKIAFDESCARFSPGAQVTRYAMRRNLEEADLAEADSLAVPDHPMITPLWRGKVPYATLVVGCGTFAGAGIALARADLAAARGLRRIARAALRRLRPAAAVAGG